jgi:two-component system response regulator NreC
MTIRWCAGAFEPDVVLMDIEMPTASGVDLTKRITERMPGVRVLVLTIFDREEFLFLALQAGAVGYVLKGADVDDLLEAIRTVHAGEVFVYPSMTGRLIKDYVARLDHGEGRGEYGKLSPREKELLPMLAENHTSEEIGEQFHISPYTVQTYRQRIMQKLNLHSRTELYKYALRRGLVQLDP